MNLEGLLMRKSIAALLLVLFLPVISSAMDYQAELTFLERVEDLRPKKLTVEQVQQTVLEYTNYYYRTSPPPGAIRRSDRLIYALDELYHERLHEILETYVQEIPDVSLENPTQEEIIRISKFLAKIAHLP
jgi:hypothetical protein